MEASGSVSECDASSIKKSGVENDDCRINCTNARSLRSILEITLEQVSSELTSDCNPNDNSEIISVFSDSFKEALEANILINELPLNLNKKSSLTTPERKTHSETMDDVLCSKLSKTISEVAHKRKYCPQRCRLIDNMAYKHDFENLKNTEIVFSPEKSTSFTTSPVKEESNVKKFATFCKNFNSIENDVQHKLEQKEKLLRKISIASDIKRQQKHRTRDK